mmetsp:Transcript_4827/g.8398  ORF Transcript_4827/g.8398 Transcript_4827/m.8398 type:complete len:86 (-) Transcript_4827:239-496(-)
MRQTKISEADLSTLCDTRYLMKQCAGLGHSTICICATALVLSLMPTLCPEFEHNESGPCKNQITHANYSTSHSITESLITEQKNL